MEYVEILGRQGRTIILATICKVCNQRNQAVPRTAHTQQVSLLLREVKPWKAFLDDFDSQGNAWLLAGHELVIAGNINEALGNDITGFARISAKHDLVEILQHTYGVEGEPPTYTRGQRRLDYIFMTEGLVTSIKQCSILPYSNIIDSDH
jgi:hypothetical protein